MVSALNCCFCVLICSLKSLQLLVFSLSPVAKAEFKTPAGFRSWETNKVRPPAAIQVLGGQLDAGNYTYYTLDQKGKVTLLLQSWHGDADVYVSTTVKRPTFFLNTHQFSAYSCGTDRIDIPAVTPRPLYIAIYAHPSQDNSRFHLFVLLTKSLDEYDTTTALDDAISQGDFSELLNRGYADQSYPDEVDPFSWSHASAAGGDYGPANSKTSTYGRGGGGSSHRDDSNNLVLSIVELVATVFKLLFEIVVEIMV